MAIYHLHLSNGSKSKGASAGIRVAYIMREKEFAHRQDELVYTESQHLPEWAKDAHDFWHAADLHERANARVYREVEIALPRELTREAQVALAREFAQDLTRANHLPYTLAVHDKKGHNPHAHLLYSERKNDGIERNRRSHFKRANMERPWEGGAPKVREMRGPEWVKSLRTQWEVTANVALEQANRPERIDARSYEAQGIALTPQIHLGVGAMAMAERGVHTERLDQYQEIKRLRVVEVELLRLMQTRDLLIKERSDEPEPTRTSAVTSAPGRDDAARPDRAAPEHARADAQGGPGAHVAGDRAATQGDRDAQGRPRQPGEVVERDGGARGQSMEGASVGAPHADAQGGDAKPGRDAQDRAVGSGDKAPGVGPEMAEHQGGAGSVGRGGAVSRDHVVDEAPGRDEPGGGGRGEGEALRRALESFNARRAQSHPRSDVHAQDHPTPSSHTSPRRDEPQPFQKEEDFQVVMEAQRQQLQAIQISTRRLELETWCKRQGWTAHDAERPMKAQLLHKEEVAGSQLVILKTSQHAFRVVEKPDVVQLHYKIKDKALHVESKPMPLPEKGTWTEWREHKLYLDADRSREQERELKKSLEKSRGFSYDR